MSLQHYSTWRIELTRYCSLGFSQDSVDVPSYAWRNWDSKFIYSIESASQPLGGKPGLIPFADGS